MDVETGTIDTAVQHLYRQQKLNGKLTIPVRSERKGGNGRSSRLLGRHWQYVSSKEDDRELPIRWGSFEDFVLTRCRSRERIMMPCIPKGEILL